MFMLTTWLIPNMNTRKLQAKTILETSNMIAQTDTQTFKVKSMTMPDKFYTVSRTGNGLVCECADHQYRKSDCKHTPLIGGYQAYYNFTKKHMGLDGKTPAEASNIKVDGINKWQTLIQNASLHSFE